MLQRAARFGKRLDGEQRLHHATGQRDLGGIVAQHAAREDELIVALRKRHGDLERKAVLLRLGERVGALVLDRVLRRENGKGGRELVGVPVDGDDPFLHRLKERGLRLGRRAVDFIDRAKTW